jgi:hypothetical protein
MVSKAFTIIKIDRVKEAPLAIPGLHRQKHFLHLLIRKRGRA